MWIKRVFKPFRTQITWNRNMELLIQALPLSLCASQQTYRYHPVSAPGRHTHIEWVGAQALVISYQSFKSVTGWWFQPIWKILVKLDHSPSRSEHDKYLKPPPSNFSVEKNTWELLFKLIWQIVYSVSSSWAIFDPSLLNLHTANGSLTLL